MPFFLTSAIDEQAYCIFAVKKQPKKKRAICVQAGAMTQTGLQSISAQNRVEEIAKL